MTSKDQSSKDSKNRMGRIGYRPFWVFLLSILVRAIHQIGAAVFLASYLIDAIPGPPRMYVILAVTSGAFLLLTEWIRHREIYRELSGISTFLKLVLLGIAYHGLFPETPTVVAAFILASLAAHAPKQYRHRILC